MQKDVLVFLVQLDLATLPKLETTPMTKRAESRKWQVLAWDSTLWLKSGWSPIWPSQFYFPAQLSPSQIQNFKKEKGEGHNLLKVIVESSLLPIDIVTRQSHFWKAPIALSGEEGMHFPSTKSLLGEIVKLSIFNRSHSDKIIKGSKDWPLRMYQTVSTLNRVSSHFFLLKKF